MLHIFNSKKIIKDESLDDPNFIEKKIMTNCFVENEYNNIIHYPYSSKEWSSSVYSYNKSYIKPLISKDAALNKLFKSYFNRLPLKKKPLFNRRRANKTRYSAKKNYVGKAELEHTNSKLSIILDVYSKKKLMIKRAIRNIITRISFNIIMVSKKKVYIANHKNRLFHLIKNNFFLIRK